jgi:hypothetical protein
MGLAISKLKIDSQTMLRQLAAFRKTHGHIRVKEHWKRHPELAGWLIAIRSRLETLSYEQILTLNSLGFFKLLDQQWLSNYARLRIFKETLGHCEVPARWEKNPGLSAWVHGHRGKAKILPWRRKLLAELGFKFRLLEKSPTMEWEDGLARLRRFKERFGHCNVPAIWSEDVAFGRWIAKLRGAKRTLPSDKIQQLTELGLDWNPLRSEWEKNFKALKTFKEQHGHCRVPNGSGPLADWVSNVRKNKQRQSPARIRKLDQLGFDWSPYETQWQTQFENFLAFKRRFGHARVPARWAENPELGGWVSTQRLTKAQLSKERIRLLEEAGFDWDPIESLWRERYEQLKEHLRRHGPENPPKAQSALGHWMDHQRDRAEKLPAHHKQLLDAIGFVWSKRTLAAWMSRYEELKAYKDKHGHCSPPAGKSSLGTWIIHQRRSRTNLSEDRRQLLDEIGFVWSTRAR